MYILKKKIYIYNSPRSLDCNSSNTHTLFCSGGHLIKVTRQCSAAGTKRRSLKSKQATKVPTKPLAATSIEHSGPEKVVNFEELAPRCYEVCQKKPRT